MNVFRDITDLPSFKNGVITIGSFDGIHRGHQKILNRLTYLADEIDGESILITFDPHPRKIIYPNDDSLILLNTLEEKIALCEKFGIKNLVIVPFSIEFSQQSPREYVEKFLIGCFNPKYIVIGYDHRFGLNRGGNIDLLKSYEEEHDFEVIKIEKQELEDITISSTKIRNALLEGDVKTANDYLNYQYSISGNVVKGDQIGQKIGFPTANVKVQDADKLIPKDGVYAAVAYVDKVAYNGMLYLGNRPTIDSNNIQHKIEINLFDFDQDIYGEEITIAFVKQLRGDQKFESLDELKSQLAKDRLASLAVFNHDTREEQALQAAVAILNYNGEEYLETYLPSVTHSSDSEFDIVVIDNKSTDGSVAYLQEWHPEVQLIEFSKNYGFAGGYNRGLRDLDHKFFAIVNSDIKVPKNWLDPIISLMESDKTIGACQPKILSIENPSEFEYAGACGGYVDVLGYPFCRGRIFDNVESDEGQYDSPQEIAWASGAAMVVRGDLFHALGGFDAEYFAHMEEIDLCLRMQRAGYKIMVVPTSKVWHLGGGTLSYDSPNKVYLNFKNSLATLIKNESGFKAFVKFYCRLLLDGVAAIKFLSEGKVKHVWKIVQAHWATFLQLPSLFKRKRAYHEMIQKASIGGPRSNGHYKRSIVWQFFAKNKKTFSALDQNDFQ